MKQSLIILFAMWIQTTFAEVIFKPEYKTVIWNSVGKLENNLYCRWSESSGNRMKLKYCYGATLVNLMTDGYLAETEIEFLGYYQIISDEEIFYEIKTGRVMKGEHVVGNWRKVNQAVFLKDGIEFYNESLLINEFDQTITFY